MQLVAKSVLWLHVSLYRLTNGRIGGRFIAGSPILLLITSASKWCDVVVSFRHDR